MSCQDGCSKHVHSPGALLRHWHHLLTTNQHAVWGAFGPPGSGKSEGNILLSIQLMDLLKKSGHLKPEAAFNVRRQIAFKPVDRSRLAKARGMKFLPILDDEATGEGGHKHRTMSTANVDNAQDLDACRGRNQPNGFAAPYMKRLADPIVDHLMGYMDWHKDHSCEWFEAIRGGDQWNPYVWWESRFTVDEPPHLQVLYPKIGKDYLHGKDEHMNGRRPDADAILTEDRLQPFAAKLFT